MAIDFETANETRASACALGWAAFDDNALVDSGSTLISPEIATDEWSEFNIAVHRIQPRDVRTAPAFPDVWRQLVQLVGARPLVAHYATFDMSVLRAELARYELSPLPLRYACSAVLARRAWPALLSVSLPLVARHLSVLLDHHDPASDVRASGSVAVAAIEALGADDLDAALAAQSLAWGQLRADLTWTPCGLSGHRLSELTAQTTDFDPAHPLFGQVVVFTGTLASMTRREAFQRVLNCGGTPEDGVTKETNILVVGEQDLAKLAVGHSMSAKQRKAAALRLRGRDIQLVGEVDFLETL